jgi:hypothetical protein
MKHTNDSDPSVKLVIVDDEPAKGDEVCIAIHPGNIFVTDRDEASQGASTEGAAAVPAHRRGGISR